MRDGKQFIRYIGFHRSDDGGRRFDFSVTAAADQHESLISVDIPAILFAGANRIMLQEGVGISYAKLKELFEIENTNDLPVEVCLTSSDISQFRDIPKARHHRKPQTPADPA